MQDRVSLIYTDTPFAFEKNFEHVSIYTDALQRAAFEALTDRGGSGYRAQDLSRRVIPSLTILP